jgi:hypothetical protein
MCGQSDVNLSPWSYLAQELWVQGGVYYLPLRWVCSWLPTYLVSFVL